MQTTEKELARPAAPEEPRSETMHLTEAEADEIFRLAEAEIQPLLKHMRRERFIGWVQGLVCVSLMLFSIAGIVWQVLTYPTTLVILYAVEKPAHLTTTLNIPTRTLAPVKLTRSLTTSTTGHGHQDARAARGSLTFYNGLFSPQSIPSGTVFTGRDGVKVSTDENVTIPAANPPQFAEALIPAHTFEIGVGANIHAGDIYTTVSNGVLVKNSPFTGGRDARDYKAVAQQDIQNLTASTTHTVNQQIPQAFSLRPGEAVKIINCTTKSIPNHAPGEEAQMVTVKTIKTCAAVAYSQDELTRQARAAFTTQTRPAGYHLIGSIQTNVISITPFQVKLTGTWVYTITPTYEQYLAERIAGDTPAQAQASLLKTGCIIQATIPQQLPKDPEYIRFFVLVG